MIKCYKEKKTDENFYPIPIAVVQVVDDVEVEVVVLYERNVPVDQDHEKDKQQKEMYFYVNNVIYGCFYKQLKG